MTPEPEELLLELEALRAENARLRAAEAEHRQTAEALRKSEQFIQKVLDSTPNLIFVKDGRGRFLLVNQAMADLFGATKDEIVAPGNDERYARPDEAHFYEEIDRDVIRTGCPRVLEETYTHRDGRTMWFHTIKTPFVQDGEVHVLGLSTDVSERKRAEAALHASEARLQAAVESLPFDFWICDRHGRYVMQNSASIKHWGDQTGRLVGEADLSDAVLGFWRESHARALSGEVVEGDVEYVHEGERHHYHCILAPIHHGRAITALLGIDIEITERKRLETQLVQAQKMGSIGRLAGGVAHDFNNLLTAILGYSELAATSLPVQSEAHSALREVRETARRGADLTRQLLAFARQQVLEPRVINLNELVLRVENLLRRILGEDIELVTMLSPELGNVRVDPVQFEQVLLNLAVNARDAMPRGGRLLVETADVRVREPVLQPGASPGPYVRIVVSDTGVGMSDEVLRHVFEPFFTTKAPGQGTGLGLATCYGIVQQNGGHISVHSEPGQGSTFTILLPRVEAPVDRPRAEARPLGQLRGTELVLLAEDEPTVRTIVAQVLRMHGYTVLETVDGDDALRLARARTEPIDLLITDVVMPRTGGRELAIALRARWPGLRVLFLSGYAEGDAGRLGPLDAQSGFLHKPFTLAALAQKVREVLDAPA